MDQWPPDYKAEFERRLRTRNALMRDPKQRVAFAIHYKHNPIAWIEDWCITFDPRAQRPNPKTMPFILFPKQREFIAYLRACLDDKADGLVEKSRDIGASWLCCAFSVWLWLYWPGTVIGWGSNKEANVDKKGDPKAIFTKIRMILEHLPSFMLPAGYSHNSHALYMRIVNPANGAAITGESGENMGRSGRTTIYFKDESAHYEHAEMVEAALGDNTDVQIDISSVNGSANVFYRKRMAGEIWMPDVPPAPEKTRVFIFDWSDHPGKTQEWHDKRERKAAAEGLIHIFRQEVERDYAGSIDKIIIRPEWVRACVDAHIKLGISDDGEKVAGQDVADGGGDKNAFGVRHGIVMKYATHNPGEASEAAQAAIPLCVQYQIDELYYDSVGVGAGFKVEVNNMMEHHSATFPRHLRVRPWNGGGAVLDPEGHIIPGDDQSPTNEDQYLNLKAQSWFRLRARCYKTYRAVKFGDKYPEDELISFSSEIECLHQLLMELCQAVHKPGAKGKTVVDKKPEGALSPNLADMVVILYNPTREVSIFDVL